jgi:hypothetical protein
MKCMCITDRFGHRLAVCPLHNGNYERDRVEIMAMSRARNSSAQRAFVSKMSRAERLAYRRRVRKSKIQAAR